MSTTWQSEDEPALDPITFAGWVRVVWRGVTLGTVVFACLALLLLVRLVERPIHGLNRPWTPFITQFVCRAAFVILGIKGTTRGRFMRHSGAVVTNVTTSRSSRTSGWPVVRAPETGSFSTSRM